MYIIYFYFINNSNVTTENEQFMPMDFQYF